MIPFNVKLKKKIMCACQRGREGGMNRGREEEERKERGRKNTGSSD